MIRKALVTGANEAFREVIEVTEPAMIRYAKTHGYEFYRIDEDTEGRVASWMKVPALRRLIRHYDAILWVDADVVIRRFDADIMDDMPKWAKIGVAIQDTLEGEIPNDGVLVLKSAKVIREFLKDWWNNEAHKRSKWNCNANFQHLIGYSINPPVKCERHTKYSRYAAYLPGEWNMLASQSTNGAFVHIADGKSAGKKADIARKLAKSYIEDV